jgi:hypothetical protein
MPNERNSNEYNYLSGRGYVRNRERSRSREREIRNIEDEILSKRRELANLQRENDYIQGDKSFNVLELLQSAVKDGARIRSTQEIPLPPPPPSAPPAYYSDIFSRSQIAPTLANNYNPDLYSRPEPMSRIIVVKSENVMDSRRNFMEKINSLLLSSRDGLVNGSHFPRSNWPLKLNGSSYSKLSEVAEDFGIKTKIITRTFYFSL